MRVNDLRPGEHLHGVKRRTLLAALLANTPDAVATDTLIDLLWQRRPPSAAANLRTYVSDLRRLLAPHGDAVRVTRSAGGYGIMVAPENVDFLRFEDRARQGLRRLHEGRLAEADAMLDEALGLWRGVPFAEVDLGVYYPPRLRALENLRWEALAASADVRLRLGRLQEAVTQLSEMVEERPHCEHSRAQLMLGLNALGRRAEALRTFMSGQRRLRDELGIEAADELQNALSLVLSGGTAKHGPDDGTASSTGPCTLLARHPAFVYDERKLSELRKRLDAPGSARQPRAISLNGPVGIGKTALATELAYRVRGAFPGGQLFLSLADSGGQWSSADIAADVLVRLGVPRADLARTADDLTAQLRGVLASRRVLLVLDAVRTPDQVRPLLPGDGTSAVVLTSRHSMRAVDSVHEVTMQRMEPELATRLLAGFIGVDRLARDPAAAGRVVRLCDGLPLALRIAAERLRRKRSLDLITLANRLAGPNRLNELQIHDLSVRDALTTAYEELDRPARRLLTVLNEADTGLTPHQLAALCDWPEPQTRLLTERLAGEGVLLEIADATGNERLVLPGLWSDVLRERSRGSTHSSPGVPHPGATRPRSRSLAAGVS